MPSSGRRIRVMRIISRMNVGGPAVQVSALLRGLDPDRYDHRVYTGSVAPGEADYQELCAPELTIHRIPTLGRSPRVGGDLRALADLVVQVRRFRPHILHTHTAKAGVLGRTAGLLARVPVLVHTFHGHLLHGYFPPAKTRLVAAVERALAGRSHHLVAVGEQVRDDLLAQRIGRAGQYSVIAPGTVLPPLPERAVARRALGLPADGPVVAYVGRVTGVKRPDRLLAVARRVRHTTPGTTFVVCGAGDRLEDTVRAAAGLGDAIRFVGWRRDVQTVYAAADLVILTSDNEGTPVSLIEAAIAGLPAVATRVGSVGEIVADGETGLLTPTDPDDLAAAVGRLLREPRLRERMGRRAGAVARARFGPDRLVADTDRLYTSIAAARGWPRTDDLVEATSR